MFLASRESAFITYFIFTTAGKCCVAAEFFSTVDSELAMRTYLCGNDLLLYQQLYLYQGNQGKSAYAEVRSDLGLGFGRHNVSFPFAAAYIYLLFFLPLHCSKKVKILFEKHILT